MWAFARFDLNLSDEEFENYTLDKLNALSQRYKEKIQQEEYFHALICSVIANVNRGKGKSFKPSDFMRKEEKKQQSLENMINVLQKFVK